MEQDSVVVKRRNQICAWRCEGQIVICQTDEYDEESYIYVEPEDAQAVADAIVCLSSEVD